MKIPTFSLPAEMTCPNSTILCRKYCYAKKAERAWKNVWKCRMDNLRFTATRTAFINKLIGYFTYTGKSFLTTSKYFRIHESGDFYDQEYLEKWFEICRSVPNKIFLAYTQMYYLDWSKKPSNLILYWSVWPDSKGVPKDGLHAYVKGDKIPNYKTKGYLCKKGKDSQVTCDKCLYCFKGKGDVTFKLH